MISQLIFSGENHRDKKMRKVHFEDTVSPAKKEGIEAAAEAARSSEDAAAESQAGVRGEKERRFGDGRYERLHSFLDDIRYAGGFVIIDFKTQKDSMVKEVLHTGQHGLMGYRVDKASVLAAGMVVLTKQVCKLVLGRTDFHTGVAPRRRYCVRASSALRVQLEHCLQANLCDTFFTATKKILEVMWSPQQVNEKITSVKKEIGDLEGEKHGKKFRIIWEVAREFGFFQTGSATISVGYA